MLQRARAKVPFAICHHWPSKWRRTNLCPRRATARTRRDRVRVSGMERHAALPESITLGRRRSSSAPCIRLATKCDTPQTISVISRWPSNSTASWPPAVATSRTATKPQSWRGVGSVWWHRRTRQANPHNAPNGYGSCDRPAPMPGSDSAAPRRLALTALV